MKNVLSVSVWLLCLASAIGAQESWPAQSSGTARWLTDVHFPARDTGYVAGDSGTILKTVNGGGAWTPQTSGANGILWSVHFVNASAGYASGQGVILKTVNGGSAWTKVFTDTSAYQYAYYVYFTDANHGVAACAKYQDASYTLSTGTLIKTTDGGSHWTTQYTNTHGADPYYLYFTSPGTGYACGFHATGAAAGNAVLKTIDSGTTWIAASLPSSSDSIFLNSIRFTGAGTGYAAGGWYNDSDYGAIVYKTTDAGGSWSVNQKASYYDNGVEQWNSVYFVNAQTGYLSGSGDSGSVYKTVNGGGAWNAAFYYTANLYNFAFTDSATGYLVGQQGSIFKRAQTTSILGFAPARRRAPGLMLDARRSRFALADGRVFNLLGRRTIGSGASATLRNTAAPVPVAMGVAAKSSAAASAPPAKPRSRAAKNPRRRIPPR